MKPNKLICPILIITLLIIVPINQAKAYNIPTNDTIPEGAAKVSADDTDDEFSSMEKELEELDSASKGDTTKIRIGKMKIEVVEDGDDIIVNKDTDWEDDQDWDDDWTWKNDDSWTFHKKRKSNSFDPHWACFSIGMNNYITADQSLSLPPDLQLLEINTNNSIEININFAEKGINLIKQRLGLVTGIGIRWNNYKFRNANTVLDTDNGVLGYSVNNDYVGKMSKLTTFYLTVPLLLEIQLPVGHEELYINAGVEGGLKLNAHTKIKTNDKQKSKNKNDFYTSIVDYRLTARAGYGDFGIYATYGMMPLFEKNKGPELYPVSAGVTFNF